MTVKELIAELLDYDMGADINIQINTKDDTDWKDFSLDDDYAINEVRLVVDLFGSSIVNAERFEELEEIEEESKEEQS
jgi:hypothetical protein